MSKYPDRVRLREVSPRDGLQTIPDGVPTADKVRMIDALSACGFAVIEAAAFVHPKWVPQMADAAEVMQKIERVDGVHYSALVPNLKGYQRAKEAGADECVLFVSASETYARKNTNRSIAESLEIQRELVEVALGDGAHLSADVSMAFGCPYEGDIPVQAVVDVVKPVVEMGVTEVYLADTTGTGSPSDIERVVSSVRDAVSGIEVGLHLHDTRGLALANVMAALELGVTRFDCSTGGIGGGPYAEGATGNVATEDLVYLLSSIGVETGIDLERLLEVGHLMEEILKKPLASKLLRAGLPKGWNAP